MSFPFANMTRYLPELDAYLSRKMTANRGATHKYEVTRTNPAEEWPEDQTLINWCDGGPTNFGGRVEKLDPDKRIVHVYVD
jgi:hypothetical protein